MFREIWDSHKFELKVMAIMLAVGFAIALGTGSDFSDALARSKR